MKKTINFGLLLAMISVAAFTSPAKAQDVKKELAGFVKKFQDAYNKKDDKALKMMYTDDAVSTGTDGTTTTGSEAIVADLKDFYTENKVSIEIKTDTAEPQADGSVVSTGTYHLTGNTKTSEKLDFTGKYTNTTVKVNGHWKISKSVLTNL